MTTVTFDIRQGGGAEPLTGGVMLTPTRTNYASSSVTMPQPQTIGLHNGKGTMSGVTPTPSGIAPAWAYRATVINGITGEEKSWLVTVPDQPTVAFDSLPRPIEVIDPTVDVNALAGAIDGATAAVTVTGTGDVVVTRVDGSTYVAGNSRGPQGFPGITDVATTTRAGIMSPGDKAKVDASASVAAVAQAREATAVVSTGTWNGTPYKLTRIIKGTTIPGLIQKQWGQGVVPTPQAGEIKPTADTVQGVFLRTGADIIINGGGVVVAPGNARDGMMDGCQIYNGTLLRDFNGPGYYRGRDAMGIRADGSMRRYSADDGATGASMIADGVVHSFSFGPAVVKAGDAQTITGTGSLSAVSARNLLAYTQDGDVLIITVPGVSDSYGITYTQAGQLAASLGAYECIPMDAGGSVQAMVSGQWINPSSDAAGPRSIYDYLTIKARVVGDLSTTWQDLTLATGFTNQDGNPGQVRLNDGTVEFQGALVNAASGTTSIRAATVPWWARPIAQQRIPSTLAASYVAYTDVLVDGTLNMYTSAQHGSPRYITNVRYPAKS